MNRQTLEHAVNLLMDNSNGFTVDVLTGERWERPGAFWAIAAFRNPIVTFDQWRGDNPQVREFVADQIDAYNLTERGNYDALGVYLADDGHTVHVDAVEMFNGHATLDQALAAGAANAQECIGVMVDGNYLGSLHL